MLLAHERVTSDEQLARGLAIIVRNAKLQARLIDDLTDVSSLLSGRTRLHIGPLSAEAAVRAANESIGSAAHAKDVQLRVAIEDDAPFVLADGERLQQILSNLLFNALKFSPYGGAIDVRVRRDQARICIEIEDDGPGVEEELAPVVFERFSQGKGNEAKGSLGLGLAIARGLVELHRGEIAVGRRARGAIFSVWLPGAAPSTFDPQLPPPQQAGFETLLTGTRIAIVDREPDASDLLRVLLERAGARVEAHGDAEQLVAAGAPFDAVISDIRAADGSGPELPALLRERGISAPAIALTGHASPRDRLRALQTGFQMHVSKPVDGHELVVTIASVLGRFLPNVR